MRHSDQVAQLKKLFDYLDTGTTAMVDEVYLNNVTDYTDPTQAEREREIFFRQYPLNLGLSCRVPKPGDFFTDDFSGVPILVVRDRAGELNAFMNVCRHRGARVAGGEGTGARAFSCPYHAWTYGLDGRLMSRPHEDAFAALDKKDHCLTRLPATEKYGSIWVCPTPDAEFDIDVHLAGLQHDFAAYGFEGYHHYGTRVLTRGMNWKLVVDTFLESYHLAFLHEKSVFPLLHGDLGTFDAFGDNLRMIVARRTIDELREKPEDEWDLVPYTAVVNVLFPNTLYIMQGDHLETWHCYPSGNGTDESRMYVSMYIPEPATTEKAQRHWDRNWELLFRTVEDEDFPLAENIQRDFHSGAQSHIAYGRNEPALGHYHRAIKQSLGLETA